MSLSIILVENLGSFCIISYRDMIQSVFSHFVKFEVVGEAQISYD